MEDVSAQAIEDVSVWDTHSALKPAAAVYKNLVINPSDANQPGSSSGNQPGFFIIGGYPPSIGKLAEFYNPLTKVIISISMTHSLFKNVLQKSCPAEDLPVETGSYTACGSLLCGGKSCYKMNENFTFSKSGVTLAWGRKDHLCWTLEENNVLLLGGGHFDTELVQSDGSSSSPRFKLKNRT